MEVDGPQPRQLEQRGRQEAPVVEREQEVGPQGAEGLPQAGLPRVPGGQHRDARAGRQRGHRLEPGRLAGIVRVGDDRHHLGPLRQAGAQAQGAHVGIAEDHHPGTRGRHRRSAGVAPAGAGPALAGSNTRWIR